MEEGKIINLEKEEGISQEQLAKTNEAQELIEKHQQEFEEHKKVLKKIEEARITNVEERAMTIKTIETIMNALNSVTYSVKTEYQNRNNEKGEKVRVVVPVNSIPVSTFESHGYAQQKDYLLARAMELLMKL
jgi:transcriptional regulator with XRE-family HTH domain